MRLALLIIPFVSVALASALAADYDHQPPAASGIAKTGKERLSDKGSDEQRVDDCKVPQPRRTRPRPTTCPWDVGS